MGLLRLYPCPQCQKKFATHSNLKRHTENPNIHNMPYKRSRDQKRWKNHAKKQVSKEETAQRMRKWRAANRDKNKRNDLRCRVYRLARQKFQDEDSMEKELFIREQINRRLGRQRLLVDKDERQPSYSPPSSSSSFSSSPSSPPHHGFYYQESLPFYNAPHHQIVLPSLKSIERIGGGFHKVHLPPLQSSLWQSCQSSPLGSPLLLQPNPIHFSYSNIPVKLTL
ncbi:hypothetical protein BC941DRAFT_347675 [Chlamydoabsidia padenii]|nr:hypothetical protein BC941DRAFT_347675 [Chlamydoabsidia padenii]